MNDVQRALLINDVTLLTVMHWLVERQSILASGRGDMLTLLRHQLDATRRLVEDNSELDDETPKAHNDT